jgi:2-methylcitrate dehydratase PrpD
MLRFETERVGEPLLILSHGLRAKRFPNCGSAHRSMDAMLELLARRPFGPREAEQVTVSAPRAHLANLMYDDPRTDLQARFSLEFALGLLIVKGECRLSDFADETIMRDDIRALYPRIRTVPRDGPASDITHDVEIVLAGGEKLQSSVIHAVGSRAAPFSWEQQWAKLDACVADLLSRDALKELRDALDRLPELPTVAPLMRALGAPVSPRPPSA